VLPDLKARLGSQVLLVAQERLEFKDLGELQGYLELMVYQDPQDRQALLVTLASSGMSVTIHHTYVEVARRCVLILMTVTSVSVLMVMRLSMNHIHAHLLRDVQLLI
jgi:hypothetical protein